MKYLQSILLILLSYFGLFVFSNVELANSSFSAYENQIFEGSNDVKVRKLQEVFKGLDLYNGSVDGDFNSIKYILLDYQVKAGIISNYEDYGAGYFGNKTIEALEKDYGEKFLSLKETYLKIDEPSLDERYFYVTAYYSPLPGQSRYTTGSYYGDVRLNGEGKVTASGKGVFAGLMAAPRNYAYGTKIYLEGIGVGSVEDRGGAIVNAGERGHDYDRIDIWMGYGDEGLERALKWGTRKVKGYVVDDNAEISIEFDESPVEKYKGLQAGPNDEEVNNIVELQKLLRDIGLYNGSIDGDYNKIKNILIKYQLESGIISNEMDSAAGYFGPKTFAAMREDYGSGNGFFKEKYYEGSVDDFDDNSFEIAQSKALKLQKLKEQLDKVLEKKYSGDALSINRFKNKLKYSLEQIIDSGISNEKKLELMYFKNILY